MDVGVRERSKRANGWLGGMVFCYISEMGSLLANGWNAWAIACDRESWGEPIRLKCSVHRVCRRLQLLKLANE